jgi:P27 family predicted phage terminase small subunit
MAKRGPKPEPKNVLKLRGSPRANKVKPTAKAAEGEMSVPRWLGKDGKELWRRLRPGLTKLGWYKPHYRLRLVLLCDAYDDFRVSTRELADDGITLTKDNGDRYIHPAYKVKTSSWSRLSAAARVFGMSPYEMMGMIEEVDKAGDVIDSKDRFFNEEEG